MPVCKRLGLDRQKVSKMDSEVRSRLNFPKAILRMRSFAGNRGYTMSESASSYYGIPEIIDISADSMSGVYDFMRAAKQLGVPFVPRKRRV